MKLTQSTFIRLLSIFFISMSLFGCDSNPDKTVDHFMSLLIAGKHLEAQDMLGRDMRGLAGMLGGVSNNTLNPYYRSGAFKSYTLTPLEKTDSSVRYKVVAVTGDGVAHEDFVDLVRDEGEWRISRF